MLQLATDFRTFRKLLGNSRDFFLVLLCTFLPPFLPSYLPSSLRCWYVLPICTVLLISSFYLSTYLSTFISIPVSETRSTRALGGMKAETSHISRRPLSVKLLCATKGLGGLEQTTGPFKKAYYWNLRKDKAGTYATAARGPGLWTRHFNKHRYRHIHIDRLPRLFYIFFLTVFSIYSSS